MACSSCERQEKLLNALTSISAQYSGDSVYMDYNSTTPVLTCCLGAFEESCRKYWGNPSSFHSAGNAAWKELEKNRAETASFFHAAPEEIYFCSSGSEAVFTALKGLEKKSESTFFITTAVEHQSVLKSIISRGRDRYHILKVDSHGSMDTAELEYVLLKKSKHKTVIAYSPVNHETGAIQPVQEIFNCALKYNAAVMLDAVQAAARMDVLLWKNYCHLFAASGHKMYAPKGCGILYKQSDIDIDPYRMGGNQEQGLFPGTENTPGIAALAAALQYLSRTFSDNQEHLKILTEEGAQILKNLPFEINIETPEDSVPGVLCISIPEVRDMEKFLIHLSANKISLSRFSACSDNLKAPSAVLLAMGRELRRAETSLRISLGIHSRREDFFILSKAISEYLRNKNNL